MLRSKSIWKYKIEVQVALQELFLLCKTNMPHGGDLLLCQQNGFIFRGRPCVGLGNDGLNCMQNINSIAMVGISEITDDNDYFIKNGYAFFNGLSELEKGIHREKSTYKDIWENAYFIRILTQIVNILNKCNYDWNLDISKLPPNGKSRHIREQIIQRLNIAPKFQQVVKIAYVGQIRNAIAHTQYHCIQGGICYDNYKSDKYATLQGLSFEQWEQKYIYSYFIFIGIFQALKQINDEYYVPISMKNIDKGVAVRIPNKEQGWYETYLYPNKEGNTWRFVKA